MVLVTDVTGRGQTRRTRTLPGFGPFLLARTIEALHQLRPIDALVPAAPAERLRLCFVPRALRGLHGFRVGADPGSLLERVDAELRPRPDRT